MASLTQNDLVLQMLAQIRMLDPSISAEVGTPERKILDTVAQALSDAQVDLTQLSGALDIDAKSGAELDKFLSMFGFGRQTAAKATGFVKFGRSVTSTTDIRIPARTQIMGPGTVINPPNDVLVNVIYETSFEVTLSAGQLTVEAPISAVIGGSSGNSAVGQVTQFAATPIYGITSITNDAPITGGVDAESDSQLKVRFKNTVFRNLAGTQDQFLALAASAKYSTKANVIGPISRYREYMQIPRVDDASAYDVDGDGIIDSGNGISGQYSTALSSIPYSKYIYTEVQSFVSNGQLGDLVFWREGIDWQLNLLSTDKNKGDAYRFFQTNTIQPITNDFGLDPTSPEATYRPSLTFLNVYTGDNDTVTSVRPEEIVLFEHSYISTASRNDFTRQLTNCVDIYIDGSNDTVASMIFAAPGASTSTQFVNDVSSKYYYSNYRLEGEPDIKPATWTTTPAPGGNYVADRFLFIPTFWQPATALPSSITVRDDTDEAIYFLDEHYWLVEDITELRGTIRSRNGICWDKQSAGATSVDGPRTANALEDFTTPGLSIEVDNYLFDKNVADLQTTIEASKQVTTDVLVHKASIKYLKFDITVMYTNGSNVTDTNNSVRSALDSFLTGLDFGNIIQLSDVLQVIHSVSGIDNVRWSQDLRGGTSSLHRAYWTNKNGVPRLFGSIFWDQDFFIFDDELPMLAQAVPDDDITGVSQRLFQALPGLIIRTRSQNTFGRA